jgi:hypothetical protein
MFQLFKKRTFGDLISDTIAFFKSYGGHYFKNYLAINGIFIVVFVAVIYFIMRIYMDFIFSMSTMANQNNNPDTIINEYFNNNLPLFIVGMIVLMLLAVFVSLLNFAFPPIYLDLLNRKKGNDFGTKEIIAELKNNTGRLILYAIASFFTMIPLTMILMVVVMLLVFILIGIPLLFIMIPALMCWFGLSFYDYMTVKSSYFDSLQNGFSLLKQKFWTTVGTSVVILIMIQVIQGIITMFPYMIGMFSMMTSLENPDAIQDGTFLQGFSFMFSLVMVLSVLLGLICNNFQFINQGLIYYSLREENEEHGSHSDIDLIGTESE